ncbi:MAG: futalosine hydrolase, partial [Bacteroidetes bacterium]|nr:futalosine hydrolase [Bacteroidota bacterium]
IKEKYDPEIECMEGAAVFYCGLNFGIPFLELRGISNYVEKRDRSKWDIENAIKVVNQGVTELIEKI